MTATLFSLLLFGCKNIGFKNIQIRPGQDQVEILEDYFAKVFEKQTLFTVRDSFQVSGS